MTTDLILEERGGIYQGKGGEEPMFLVERIAFAKAVWLGVGAGMVPSEN